MQGQHFWGDSPLWGCCGCLHSPREGALWGLFPHPLLPRALQALGLVGSIRKRVLLLWQASALPLLGQRQEGGSVRLGAECKGTTRLFDPLLCATQHPFVSRYQLTSF